jgi:hypothetical protein
MQVTIGGKELRLKFNNFAHIELAKLLFPDKHLIYNPNDVVERLNEIGESNPLLLMKYLIYAGVAGNDLETGFSVGISHTEIGELLGKSEFNETIKVWDEFLKAMGLNALEGVEDVPEPDMEGSEKKS